ncbi:MAG: hypothetical protein RLZZ244_2391 [Verrucomicrobiota bacterium]
MGSKFWRLKGASNRGSKAIAALLRFGGETIGSAAGGSGALLRSEGPLGLLALRARVRGNRDGSLLEMKHVVRELERFPRVMRDVQHGKGEAFL